MLDFGFSEILLTSAIALVVLGPERLPKVARQVGNFHRCLHLLIGEDLNPGEVLGSASRGKQLYPIRAAGRR